MKAQHLWAQASYDFQNSWEQIGTDTADSQFRQTSERALSALGNYRDDLGRDFTIHDFQAALIDECPEGPTYTLLLDQGPIGWFGMSLEAIGQSSRHEGYRFWPDALLRFADDTQAELTALSILDPPGRHPAWRDVAWLLSPEAIRLATRAAAQIALTRVERRLLVGINDLVDYE